MFLLSHSFITGTKLRFRWLLSVSRETTWTVVKLFHILVNLVAMIQVAWLDVGSAFILWKMFSRVEPLNLLGCLVAECFLILTGSSKKPKIGIIVGIVGGLIVLISGGLLFFLCKGRHKGYKREVFVDVAGWRYSSLYWYGWKGFTFL